MTYLVVLHRPVEWHGFSETEAPQVGRAALTGLRRFCTVHNSGLGTHADPVCRFRRAAVFEDGRAGRRRRGAAEGAGRERARGRRGFAAVPRHAGRARGRARV